MLKQIFWRGLKVTIPIAVTVGLTVWVIAGLEKLFGSLLESIIGPHYYFPGLGFIVGIALIFCVGLFVNAWYIQPLYSWGERLLKRIPVIKTLYASMSDLMGFFDPQRPHERGAPVLMKTALGEVIGFITAEETNRLPKELRRDELIGVYIPLSYQIGGIMVFVPKSSVSPLSMPVDQAMGFVLSAGMAGQEQ